MESHPIERNGAAAAVTPAPARAERLLAQYRGVRRTSAWLVEPLSPEDCTPQSMTDASPVKWHLAHTTWFFETFVLANRAQHRDYHPDYRYLFNSYYNSVGEQYARPERGLVTRPSLDEVLDYRQHVDAQISELLTAGDISPRMARVIELGCHHEQQHQELLVTDFKHLLSFNPMCPVYRERSEGPLTDPDPLSWHRYEGGVVPIGHQGEHFAFDSETPRHQSHVQPYELASRPVTNGEYLAFIEEGGYKKPELWLADGWMKVQAEGWEAPLYWQERDGGWKVQTLAGLRDVRADEPVCHVSLYEADAYASWVGARLPTESEWEHAASRGRPQTAPAAPGEGEAGAGTGSGGGFLEGGRFHPEPVAPRAANPVQLLGNVWEWTRSAYGPYPGFRPLSGPLGEYNGKFMCNQMVLRGGSCATPRSHIRPTYRNFFYPEARWQFSGVRLARDV